MCPVLTRGAETGISDDECVCVVTVSCLCVTGQDCSSLPKILLHPPGAESPVKSVVSPSRACTNPLRIVSYRIVLLWKNGPVLTPCSRSSLHWGSSSIIFFLSPSLRSSISGYSLKGFSFLSVGKYGCAVNLPPWLRRRVLVHFGVYFRTWCSMDSVSWETLAYFSFGRLQHILVKNPLVM